MNKGYAYASRIIGSNNLSTTERPDDDYYATDPIAAEWLIKMENLKPRIWECACGEGHLSKVFTEHGYQVLSTDLVDRGFGITGIDFLRVNDQWDGDIVTNPPYSLAQEFIEHAMDIVKEGSKVCMFLRLQFLESQKRQIMFNKYPPKRIWVSSSRIKCGRNGDFSGSSSMLCQAWYIFEKGYQGEMVTKLFN